MKDIHSHVLARIEDLYKMLYEHSGYGEMSIEVRYLRKHEKEILIRCGKQYRFIVPFECPGKDKCEGDCKTDSCPLMNKKVNERKLSTGTRILSKP